MTALIEFFPAAIKVVPKEASQLLYKDINHELNEVVSGWNGSADDTDRVWFLAASYFLNRIVLSEDEEQDYADDLRVVAKTKHGLLSVATAAYVSIYNRKPAPAS